MFAYDANGNTLSDPSGKSYSWDFENRLIQAVVPGTNGGTTTFKYDPFGRRIQKSGPLGTTNYLYDGDGDNVIEEVDGGGNVLARYTEGLETDELLSLLRSGTTSYFEQDTLSSVTSLSNAAGSLANTYTFDSFGNVTASTGGFVNPFQFTGREFDSETGAYYYRARYYDQGVGRFRSEDPIRVRGGIDFYTYVHNNAVRYRDPSGLCGCSITVRCHNVPESSNIGVHCYFVAADSNGNYQIISAHATSGIDGPIIVGDTVTSQPPSDPGSWQIYKTSDPNCQKTNCLSGLAPLFTALRIPYRWFNFNSTSVASQLAKGCGMNVSFPVRGFGWIVR